MDAGAADTVRCTHYASMTQDDRGCASRLLPDRPHGNIDTHFVANVRCMFASVELRPLDQGGGIGANGVLLERGTDWRGGALLSGIVKI